MLRRSLALLAVVVALTGLLAAGASAVPALQITCAPGGPQDQACRDTVFAAQERGLAPFHPLILAAHVEPGPAADPGQNGHRATVTFDLLGIPGPTRVRLFYDIGGHWGGVPDRGALELAAWSLLVAMVAVSLGAAVITLLGLARRKG